MTKSIDTIRISLFFLYESERDFYKEALDNFFKNKLGKVRITKYIIYVEIFDLKHDLTKVITIFDKLLNDTKKAWKKEELKNEKK